MTKHLLQLAAVVAAANLHAADVPPVWPVDAGQVLERTSFQTSKPWGETGDLRADVAMCYGIDPSLPDRIKTWRDHGYRIHVMTGVAWGNYQDYQYGKFDGINHEDEEQTDRNGNKHGHGGDVYYMCPGTNYGRFLCVGVQRALDAGAEAIHLEEPEFWVRDGYEGGFKREWQDYYHEEWQPPHGSVDASWRASKLKYFLYRRALQQVFDYVQDFNRRTGRKVRCYVPTHSLINYSSWGIVSPESSLGRLNGCDGYIAQVWTGTARTPNVYRGVEKERTFETAFLEYGAMQNLVRATGRTVWYLNDPIEDNPNHDWNDYQRNWESTLVASLLQPEVWRFEIAPWPERIFGVKYPRRGPNRQGIPPAYATELQTVFNALNDLNQPDAAWDAGPAGIGVLVSDSLMFERGDPHPSDARMGHFYGLALPLVKRGIPVAPVQLENLTLPHSLDGFQVLVMTYQGMKPLSADVHDALADWVRKGGRLVFCDDDTDPFNKVRDWWNTGEFHFATPREHLFQKLGLTKEQDGAASSGKVVAVGRGSMVWLKESPVRLADRPDGDIRLNEIVKQAATSAGLNWREVNHLLLRRGPYLAAAGLDESVAGEPKVLSGRFVNLFDAALRVQRSITIQPGSRYFLLDLDAKRSREPAMLASACRTLPLARPAGELAFAMEGVAGTPATLLLRAPRAPKSVTLDGKTLDSIEYSGDEHLLWMRCTNESRPRELSIRFTDGGGGQ